MYKSDWLLQKFWMHRMQLLNFLIVYSSLNNKHSTITVYLDFSKSFYTINHDLLMSKLLHNGITGDMQSWFRSCLVILNNMSQSKTQVPGVLHYIRCSSRIGVGPQYFFFCISMTFIDPQARCVLFILLPIHQFLHPTVTLTMVMPCEHGTGRSW